jgi:hypothetical protein
MQIAFWRDINIRPSKDQGAARPYPYPVDHKVTKVKQGKAGATKASVLVRNGADTWPQLHALSGQLDPLQTPSALAAPLPVTPAFVAPVWEDIIFQSGDKEKQKGKGKEQAVIKPKKGAVPTLQELTARGQLPPYDQCFQGF